ncbi:hypothetical protein SAMN05443637_103324 [Pseudonocardia thermophila]|jgi:hypothetical protein|uniref:Uncharacterized protein n=1 Tax=Pseudonocardia thermophila TaxID=1848 RepID=A0A1M6QH93_PSETH|nr:hypothetical protein [Pseudonocardia thermophila]SHK19612.1 hypothetical protein SAMN05443637_103324 [Pseudonocardia thermophila]
MTWVHWVAIGLGSWFAASFPAALLFGRLLRGRDPLDAIPVIADIDRRPLPPALRVAEAPTVTS